MSTPQRAPATRAPLSFGLILLIAAIVCLAIATLIDVSIFSGNEAAWRDGGLLALAASFLVR